MVCCEWGGTSYNLSGRQTVGVVLGVLLFPKAAMVVTTLIVAVWAVRRMHARHVAAVAARKAYADMLVQRCEQQHQQVMAGDPAGVYGLYPPAPNLDVRVSV